MELLYTLLRVLFPHYCLSCRSYGDVLCTECIRNLTISQPLLEPHFYAGLSYQEHSTRKIVQYLKSRRALPLRKPLAQRMHECCAEDLADLVAMKNFHNPIIIPIPGSREKLRAYGFNHAELLSQSFIEYIHDYQPVLQTDILLKRPTASKQALTHSRSERFANMEHVFYCNPATTQCLHNACVIVIDDVITTGATCAAARSALLDAGARIVVCVALAH